MIKSGKIFFKSMAVIAVLLLTFTTTTKVTFANEVLTAPEPTSISILPTESSAGDYLSDVKELLVLPFGGVAQILTDAGYASCFVGPRTVVIF